MEARPDRFTAFVDANVLVPVFCRNLLLSLAREGLFRLRLSERVLQEFERALPVAVDGMTAEIARKQAEQIRTNFPANFVEDFEHLEPMFTSGPDPDDAHVMAAAFKCDAAVIVTANLKDFPDELLARSGMEAIGPDTFLADAIDLDQERACAAIRSMRLRLKRPEIGPEELVELCGRRKLPLVADLLRGNLDAI